MRGCSRLPASSSACRRRRFDGRSACHVGFVFFCSFSFPRLPHFILLFCSLRGAISTGGSPREREPVEGRRGEFSGRRKGRQSRESDERVRLLPPYSNIRCLVAFDYLSARSMLFCIGRRRVGLCGNFVQHRAGIMLSFATQSCSFV